MSNYPDNFSPRRFDEYYYESYDRYLFDIDHEREFLKSKLKEFQEYKNKNVNDYDTICDEINDRLWELNREEEKFREAERVSN